MRGICRCLRRRRQNYTRTTLVEIRDLIAKLGIALIGPGQRFCCCCTSTLDIVLVEQRARHPVARPSSRRTLRVFGNESVQMPQCPIVIRSCQLQLRETNQRILDSWRKWMVHDDAPIVHFRIRRRCRKHTPPVDSLGVVIRPRSSY